MKSVMTKNFGSLPSINIPRSKFDRSHGYKTTFDAGKLIPIFWDEALPGDTHKVNLNAFARLATPIKPIMDNMSMDFFFFSVPLRLIWNNFQKFMGEQIDPGDSTDYTVPQLVASNIQPNTILDYFSLPILTTNNVSIAAFNTRAYNLCWNEWFRDENLQNSITVDKGDGPDNLSNYVLQNRGKRLDYFTSALPWPQKGDAVEMPLGSSAPVNRVTNAPAWETYLAGTETQNTTLQGIETTANAETQMSSQGPSSFDPMGGLIADLSAAIAPTINTLRQAFQIQSMLETDARGGTRYTEKIQAHFGVTSPDARLQRPEYLGGGSLKININPVTQTSETLNTDQGNMAAYGTAGGGNIGFNASFTEHCVIIGMVAVRADLTYQQGIERGFLRKTIHDYYWPALANIGEQVLENQEIFFDDVTPSNNTDPFGYQERYAEYRYKPSKITGTFRSDNPASIDIWHLSQDFATLPTLSSTFIEDNPPIDRIIATPTEPHFLYDSYINQTSIRPMPMYGIPFNFSRL